MINIKDLPDNVTLNNSNCQIQSANGSKIRVEGEVEKLPIEIDGEKHEIKALVIEGQPQYPILGAEFIYQNPNSIHRLISDGSKGTVETEIKTKNSLQSINEILN